MAKKAKVKKTKGIVIECPKCHAEWATFTYGPQGEIFAKNVKVLVGKKVFKDGDALTCSLCGYEHTTWDIFLAIGTGARKND